MKNDIKWILKKYSLRLLILFLILLIIWGIVRKKGGDSNAGVGHPANLIEEGSLAEKEKGEVDAELWEKGYQLPIDKDMRKEAEEECMSMMYLSHEVTVSMNGDEDKSWNQVLTDEAAAKIVEAIGKMGHPAVFISTYPDSMMNYEKMEKFLKNVSLGKECEEIVYEVYSSGNISRKSFQFDGSKMYLLSCVGTWIEEEVPGISEISLTRVKEWQYTEKGWLCYELCVPEPPEVTEVVTGTAMLRVKPINEEYREIGKRWLLPIGYQGNNLLRIEWDSEHMEGLHYNRLYESLYFIEYQEKFEGIQDSEGIPREEFENLLMKYLPVSAEELRTNAAYDAEKEQYAWERLGCGNYAPNVFGTSIPEVTGIVENADGSVTIMVDVVCENSGNERVMSHEVTMRITEDGAEYLGNRYVL